MSVPVELLPNQDEIARFMRAVFRHADLEGFVALKVFNDANVGSAALHDESVKLGAVDFLDRVVQVAFKAANLTVSAVFCPPAAVFRSEYRARREDLLGGVAIVAECDAYPRRALERLRAILGPPTIVVESGGRWLNPETGTEEPKAHCYWRLTKPTSNSEEHADLRTARKLVADLVGADASASSLVHPLRWPGSWHRKGTPRLARIVEENDVELSLADALKRLRTVPVVDYIRQPGDRARGLPNPDKTAESADVAAALAVIPNQDWSWDEWSSLALATWAATEGDPHEGFDAFDAWSAKSATKYDPTRTEEKWAHIGNSPPTEIGAGSIFYLATRFNPGWVKPSARFDVTKWWEAPRDAPLFDIGGADVLPSLRLIDPTHYQGLSIPTRRWVVTGWIPWGSVTGLYGEGGLGKTLIAQQLQTAAAVGRSWLGLETAPLRSLGVYCEDTEDELWRRQADIDRLYGCEFRDLAAARWIPRATDDNVLVRFAKDGSLERTDFYGQIIEAAKDHHAEFIILDTASDVFVGNENDRGQVKRFVSQGLGSLAQAIGGSVLVLLHPSRAGIASGSGDSGSTAWNGAFRSRLSLEAPSPDKGERPDRDARELVRKKSNYAARGDTIAMHWRNGVLILDTPAGGEQRPQRPCAEVFLALLDSSNAGGRWVSENNRSGNYAPKRFEKHPDREGYRAEDFVRAMERLFAAGAIKIESYGRPGDDRKRIARAVNDGREAVA